MINISEIECRRVLWTWLNALDGNRKKSCKSGRVKTRLYANISIKVLEDNKVDKIELTKIRIASHSPFHLSVVFLSSSSDLSRYMVNKASDLSTDLDSLDGSPCHSSSDGGSGG